MNCPHCGKENHDDDAFCMHCGKPMSDAPSAANQQPAAIRIDSGNTPPVPLGPAPGVPEQARIGTSANTASSTDTMNIWGPFAGYGKRGRHVAWLLDDCGSRAEQLRNAVQTRFEKRQIPDTVVIMKMLQLRGVNPDPRPYFLLQRRRATVALYVSQFGKDLYVSQVSYSLGPLSMVRLWAFIAMVLYASLFTPILIFIGGIGAAFSNNIGGLLGSMLLLCCGGPLFLISVLGVIFVMAVASYRFVTDKDILAPFRVTTNEFDNDDLIALEKAAEQTVRDSLDEVNVDRTLMPVAPQYGMRPHFGL